MEQSLPPLPELILSVPVLVPLEAAVPSAWSSKSLKSSSKPQPTIPKAAASNKIGTVARIASSIAELAGAK